MKSTQRPLILVANDDGINAKGIHALVDVAVKIGDVIVVAPMAQHSGQSSAITVNGFLRVKQYPDYHGARMYGVSGTPVDCVKIAMHTLLPRKPDLMFSGINHGSNAGNCAIYSGTIGAAMETCMAGVPSVGFSLLSHDPDADFEPILPLVEKIARRAAAGAVPREICLNVNFPAGCTPKGVKAVRAALGYWTDEYVEYRDPFGQPFYMLSGSFVNAEPDATDTDEYWLARGYASIVPIYPDQSALQVIPQIAAEFGNL